jgi:bifunctional DNA-binding transcriptional regulator/antitoxin component of YhaV-PrlF toxin-antitoxin module
MTTLATTAALTDKGEITISEAIRTALGWQLGEILAVADGELTADHVTLRAYRLLLESSAGASPVALTLLKGEGLVLLPEPVRRTLGVRRGVRVRVAEIGGGVRLSLVTR